MHARCAFIPILPRRAIVRDPGQCSGGAVAVHDIEQVYSLRLKYGEYPLVEAGFELRKPVETYSSKLLVQRIRLLARALKYRFREDPAEVKFLRRTVRPGWCTFDLGAHKGAYTYWLAAGVGRTGRVICVEPQRHLAETLQRVMRSCPQVSVKWAAVSDRTGTGTLSLRPDGSSHGASIAGFADGRVGATVEVPTVTLGDLVAEFNLSRLDFIKCDIEGHEGVVFAAAGEVIERFSPVILVECEERHAYGQHGGVAGLVRIFERHGYRVHFFLRGRLTPIEQFDPAVHQRCVDAEYVNNFVLEPAKRRGD